MAILKVQWVQNRKEVVENVENIKFFWISNVKEMQNEGEDHRLIKKGIRK